MEKKEKGITKISALFEKYTSRLIAPESSVIEAFREVAEDMFGFSVKKEQCSYSAYTKTLKLNLSGPPKSEIMLRKEEVLAHLKGRLGEQNAPQNII